MKALACVVISLAACVGIRAQWEPLPALPLPSGGFAAGCVQGKIVVAGGTTWKDGVKQWLSSVWIFDPKSMQWTNGPELPHPLAYPAFGSNGEHLFIAGGADGDVTRREMYRLDTIGIIEHLGDLHEPVAYAGSAWRKGALCVFGGTPAIADWAQSSRRLTAIELQSGKPSSLAVLALIDHGICIPAVVSVGTKVFVFTGAMLDPATKEVVNLADAFVHDQTSDTWKRIAPYPQAARGVSAVALDDHRIYLAGGYGTDAEAFLAKAWIYNIETNSYKPALALPMPALTCLVKCGDAVYALGGEDKKQHRTEKCFRVRLEDLTKTK